MYHVTHAVLRKDMNKQTILLFLTLFSKNCYKIWFVYFKGEINKNNNHT